MFNLKKLFAGMSWGTPWKLALQKRILVLELCVVVGTLAGLASSLMHTIAEWLHAHRTALFGSDARLAFWLEPALPALGIFFCVILTSLLWRRRPYETSLWIAIREARHPDRGMREYHAYSHILTSGVSVGMGISAGMEAPSALTGAAIGDNLGRKLGLPRETRTLLLCAGAAAAIAGVFSAPLAGALFACEVLLPGSSAVTLIPLLIASASGAIVSQMCGVNVHLPATDYAWHLKNLWLYILVGLVCGLMSAAIIRLNCLSMALRRRIGSPWLVAAAGVLLLYAVFLLMPMVGGSGLDSVLEMMDGDYTTLQHGLLDIPDSTGWLLVAGLALCAFIKPVASMISIQSGGDGGMFAPSLVTGAFLGACFHQFLELGSITGFPLINCMAAGMAGVLAGVMHAPLTGLFLIAELLGGYELFVPLMIVVALSSFTSKCLSRGNIYFAAAGLNRNSKRKPWVSECLDDCQDTPVGELATRDLYTLAPRDTFRTLLKVLMQSPQEIFPVLDRNGKLVGVIRERNLRPFLLDKSLYDILVADDFMGPAPVALPADATLAEATRLFDTTGADFIPVARDDGRFVGILTPGHILESHRSFLNHQDIF